MKRSDDLISVIVPVYNVENYLERCINSITGQTYDNLEIILVDDGSKDQSGKICDRLAERDSRIKVLHNRNSGVSAARNCGVEQSSGKYITFVDSDDFIAPDYVEVLYSLLCEQNADISAVSFYITSEDDFKPGENAGLPALQTLTGREACFELLKGAENYNHLVIVWAKLLKSEIVKKHPFPVGKVHEDEATTAKYLYEAQRIVISNKVRYAYYCNDNSITHKNADRKKPDLIWALRHRADYFDSLGEKQLTQSSYAFLLTYLIEDSVNHNGRCNEEIKALAAPDKLSTKNRIRRRLFLISPKLYCAAKSAYRKLRSR